MPDPEGFKAGSAWMSVRPNIDEAEWHAKIAAAVEAASAGAGPELGRGLTAGLQDAKPGLIRDADEIAGDVGKSLGDGTSTQFTGRLRDARGRFITAGQTIGEDIGEGIPTGIDPGLGGFDKKVKDSTKKTAQAAGQGMSPLLLGAFTAAGTFGPAALLAGTSLAVVGIGAAISRSNADVQAEYKTLATDVSSAMTEAVSPLAPAIETAMAQADNSVRGLGPVLKQTFADAAPDVTAFGTGITGLVSNALPGLDTAINQSRGIVSGFSGSLPTLGTGAGRFFAGLTTDAQSTQRGITDFVDVTSNALGTLGHVAGSASAALSTDFAAVTPVLNGALGVIDKLASPATIGGVIGLAGALKFDPAISTGLQKVSNSLTTVAAKADGSTGLLGKAGGAAESAAGGFGKMADVMGGPWGVAIGAGIGLLGGLVSSMTQSIATVSDFSAAVAQDNGVVGASTTAIIQKKLASVDLSSAQQELGVSQATLIEYAAGEADAQKKVRDAYTSKVSALEASGKISAQNANATVAGNQAAQGEINTLHQAMDSVDQVTAAVAGAVKAQNDLNKTYLAVTKSAGVFSGLVDTATTGLQTSANQTAISTVASLQLGSAQGQLGQSLSNIMYNYQLTADSAQGYQSVLTAMNGTTTSLTDAQNALDQSMLNAKSSFKANKFSLDENTQAGIDDRDALSAAAKQITAVGVANYQAHGNIDQANNVIRTQIDAFVKNTGATGNAKKAIEDYLVKLAQIPPGVSTTVTANTGPANKALAGLIDKIDTSYGTVQVHVSSTGLGMSTSRGAATPARAGGGLVTAGSMSTISEHGEEAVLWGSDGYVLTHGQTVAMQSRPAAQAAAPTINIYFNGSALPNQEQQADLLRQLRMAVA
jgi:hypothetical protein